MRYYDDEAMAVIGGIVFFISLLILLACIGSCDKDPPQPATSKSDTSYCRKKVLGIWKNDKHTIEFTPGSHVILDGKFSYYDFYGHGLARPPIFLHLGRNKTNEFTFEATEKELILVFSRKCGWQTDIDKDDDLMDFQGRYIRVGEVSEVSDTPPDKLSKLKLKLDICQKQYDKVNIVLKKMDADKSVIVKRLNDMGVKSKDNLKGNRAAQLLAKELVELAQERNNVAKDCEEIAYKITHIGSILRRMERQAEVEGATLSDKEIDEVLVDMDDKLKGNKSKVVESMEMGDILEKELK